MSRTATELLFDEKITRLLTADQIVEIYNNAEKIVWHPDIDGTITVPGGHLTEGFKDIANRNPDQVVPCTAQHESYVDAIGGRGLKSLIAEMGMYEKYNGQVVKKPSPPQVPQMVGEMRALLGTFTHEFRLNVKSAGYAVEHGDDAPADDMQAIRALFDKQAADNDEFVVIPTAGFIDITLKSLSKGEAVKDFARHLPKNAHTIACGDSPVTDGPMLDVTKMGFMVKKPYRSFHVVAGPDEMNDIIAWWDAVLQAKKAELAEKLRR